MRTVKGIVLFFLFLGLGVALFVMLLRDTGIDLIIEKLLTFSIEAFVLFVVISFLNFFLYVLRWQWILRAHGHFLSFWNLFFYRMVALTASYLTPTMQMGGEPFRLYFLHKEGVSVKDGTSSVLIDKFLEVVAMIIFVLISCGMYVASGSQLDGKLLLGIGGFALLFLMGIFFVYLTINGQGFFTSVFSFLGLFRFRPLKKYQEKILSLELTLQHFFVKERKVLVATFLLSLLMYLIIVFEYMMLLYFLGAIITFVQGFVIATLPSAALFLPVPGGVGVVEGAQVATFSFIHLDPALALVVVLILRLRDIVFLLVGFGYAFYYGFDRMRSEVHLYWKKERK